MSALPSLQVLERRTGYTQSSTCTPAAWTLPPIPRRRLLIQPTQSR